MKKSIILLFSLLLCLSVNSQNVKNVPIIADWSVGDKFAFDVQNSKTSKGTTKNVNYECFITVVDSTADEYKLLFSYKGMQNELFSDDTIFDNVDFSKFDFESINNIYYYTNNVGEFLRIDNWEYLLNKSIEIAESILKSTELDTAIISTSLAFVRLQYNSEESVAGLYDEIQIIHNLLGRQVSAKPVKKKTTLPTVVGSMPATVTATLEDYNSETKYCRAQIATTINDKAMKNYLKKFFKNMGYPIPADVLNSMKIESFDNTTSEYIANTGVPLRFEKISGAKVSGLGQYEENINRKVITNKKFKKA